MIQQLLFALKDMKRKQVFIVLSIIELIFVLIYFSITGHQALNTIQSVDFLRSLKKYDIVYYGTQDQVTSYDEDVYKNLEEALMKNKAYTVIPKSDLEVYPQYEIIVVMGAFDELFGLNKIREHSRDETVCYVGENVKLGIGERVELGELEKVSTEIVARIPSGKRYVSGSYVGSFKNTIVISTNIKDFQNAFYPMSLVESTAFIRPNSEFLRNYQIACDNANLNVTPRSLLKDSDHMRKAFVEDSLLSTVLFFFVLIFVLLSILINIIQIVDSNKREYSIHILYGATGKEIFSRTFFFVLSVVIPMIFIYYVLLDDFLEGIQLPITVLMLFMIVTSFLLCFIGLFQFMYVGFWSYFERDE